ncbi:aldo/keto reductase [Propionibacterium freudenreichii]|uniref:aldo/keto reductase n=1 Tax=Propionibacterium freudenreichii TaxID=1744 RepID=UPI003852A9AC
MIIPTTPTPTVELSGGTRMPMLGMGTWPLKGEECRAAVASAIEQGYRLVDTAEAYGNEEAVGKAVREAGPDRAEIFVTTKFSKQWHSRKGVHEALEHSLERLGLDYVDLFLMHWPMPGEGSYVDAYRGMVELKEQGLAKAIGVSNFKVHHLDDLITEGMTPEVNQIQLDPSRPRLEVRDFLDNHDIVTEAWSPLGRGADGVLNAPAVLDAAKKHGITPAVAVLAWELNQGIVTIPKSANPEHQRTNLEAIGVELSAQEMKAIDALADPNAKIDDSDKTGN